MKKAHLIQTVLAGLSVTFLASFAIATTDGKKSVRVDLTMTPEQRNELLTPKKVSLYNTEMKVTEKGRLTVHTYVTAASRGQSSMMFPRKNLKVQSVYEDENGKRQKIKIAGIESKKLILSAGSVDPLLSKNMTVYRLYEAIGLPTMKTAYAEVTINGVSQGLHMVSESPDDHIIDKLNADVVFRRGYVDSLELREAKKSLSEADIASYTKEVQAIYTDLKKLKGQELLASLERRMNFKNYLRMLAMNYLIRNGDYYDELYLYGSKNQSNETYFDVFPWDFDDAFTSRMHLAQVPGYSNNGRSERSQKQLIFSFESRIDMAISQDAVLLNKYFEVFEEVVTQLTNEKINTVFSTVFDLMIPYMNDPDILSQGLLDSAKAPYTVVQVNTDHYTRRVDLIANVETARAELNLIRTETDTRAKKMDRLKVMIGRLQQKLIRKITNR